VHWKKRKKLQHVVKNFLFIFLLHNGHAFLLGGLTNKKVSRCGRTSRFIAKKPGLLQAVIASVDANTNNPPNQHLLINVHFFRKHNKI